MTERIAGIGDNSMTEAAQVVQDREVLLYHHLGQIEDIDAQIKPLQEERKRRRRLAKADGFELGDEIDFGLRIMRAETDTHLATGLAKRLGVASALGVPVNFQFSLFEKGSQPEIERATESGLRAGLMGKSPSAPYPTATAEGQAWMSGHSEGSRRRTDALLRALAQREAAENAEGDIAPAATVEPVSAAPIASGEPAAAPVAAPARRRRRTAEQIAADNAALAARQVIPEAPTAASPLPAANAAPAAPRRRGRPPGSRNRNADAPQPADNGVPAGTDPFAAPIAGNA